MLTCASARRARSTSVSVSPLTMRKGSAPTIGAREPRTARAAENPRQFPRIADASAEVAAVAEPGRQRRGPMMQVQHQVLDALRDQPRDDAADHRCAGDRNRRLGANVGERAAGACRGPPSEPVRDVSSTQGHRGHKAKGLRDTHPERASAKGGRADALAEEQHLVRAADASREHERLELWIADCGLRIGQAFEQSHQQVCLIEKAERDHAFGFGRRANAREIDVRGEILLAGLLQPRRAIG